MTAPLTTYADYLSALGRINATDYQDSGSQAHIRALALPLDDLALRARTVMLSRLIQYAPEDALLLLGRERGIRHFVDEPLEIYRARVLGAWEYWQWAGTVRGIETTLRQAGYNARVIEHFRDPDQAHWAEFSIIVQPIQPLTPGGKWDDGATWDDGASWNFKLPATPLSGLLDLIREVKPAHARLRRLLLDTWEYVWDGAVIWGTDDGGVVQHNWGSPWGLPSVVLLDGADAEFEWDAPRYEVIYEMEGAIGNAEDY